MQACLGLVLLVSISQSVELRCNFEVVPWPITGTHYSCDPAYMTDPTNPRYVTEIRGDHLVGKTNSDVIVFSSAKNSMLEKLPKGIGKIFPNLLLFRWVGGNLKSVSAKDLKHFRKLTGITFRENKIHSLDADLFRHTRTLRILSFKSNELTHVGSGLLDGLDELYEAVFLNNTCIDYEAMSKTEVKTLKSLLERDCTDPTERAIKVTHA